MLPNGGKLEITCSQCHELWPCEFSKLRSILTRVHEAIGEDPNSDDESLPDIIAQMVKEYKERIKWLETETESLREANHPYPL
jgi:hypothetical protein